MIYIYIYVDNQANKKKQLATLEGKKNKVG